MAHLDGYWVEKNYTQGYYELLSPVLLNLNLALAGIQSSTFGESDVTPRDGFNYLELGFGMGASINIHAATTKGNYIGTDFNPSHVLNAREYIKIDNITLYNDSFKELLARFEKEKVEFDYITFHGIFSWVVQEHRDTILTIIRKFLKVGGVVYNSYNCLPGWTTAIPLKEVLKLYYKNNKNINIDFFTSLENNLNFLSDFLKTNPLFLNNLPALNSILESWHGMKGSTYLAHEFFNDEWKTFYFYEVADLMEKQARCQFACLADFFSHFNDFNFTQEAMQFLNTVDNPTFREQLKDYYVNRQFRMDIYVKGLQKIPQVESYQRVFNTHFILKNLPEYFNERVGITVGEFTVNKEMYNKLLEFLASESYRPKTGHEIMEKVKMDPQALIIAIVVLIRQGIISPAQKPDIAILHNAKAYNNNIFDKEIMDLSIIHIAAPVIGSCIGISELERLMMKSYIGGARTKEDLIKGTIALLERSKRQFIAGGNTPEEQQATAKKEMEKYAEEFIKKEQIYKSLKILD